MAVKRIAFVSKNCNTFVLSSNVFHPQTENVAVNKRPAKLRQIKGESTKIRMVKIVKSTVCERLTS